MRLIRMTKLFRLLRVGRAAKYIAFYRRVLEDKLKIRITDGTMLITFCLQRGLEREMATLEP